MDYLNKKVLMFTHNDLDGYGCFVVTKHYNKYVRYYACNYGNIESKIKHSLDSKEYLEYDYILITDISVSEIFYEYLMDFSKNNNIPILLFDHHDSALVLNKYESVICKTKIEGTDIFNCGTLIVYNWFLSLTKKNEIVLEEFAEIIRSYDTWDWKKNNDIIPYQLNCLFYILPRNEFYQSLTNKINKNAFIFSDNEKFLLRMEENRKQIYITSKLKNIIHKTLQDYKVAIVFGEQYINEVCESLLEDKEIDIAIVVGFNGVSYRRAEQKEINLNLFASKYGGGGHEFSSGSTITSKQKEEFLNIIFN